MLEGDKKKKGSLVLPVSAALLVLASAAAVTGYVGHKRGWSEVLKKKWEEAKKYFKYNVMHQYKQFDLDQGRALVKQLLERVRTVPYHEYRTYEHEVLSGYSPKAQEKIRTAVTQSLERSN